jgi:hypothetical protein
MKNDSTSLSDRLSNPPTSTSFLSGGFDMAPVNRQSQPRCAGPFRPELMAENWSMALPAVASSKKRPPSAAILTGESGTNLVLSRLQGWGIAAQASMAGVAYDIVADIAGFDMMRVQVKTKSRPLNGRCSFNLTRGFYLSKSGMFPYANDDFDIAALVCLEIGQIFFCAAPVRRFSFQADWLRMPDTDRDTLKIALRTLQNRRRAETLAWLASMEPDPPTPSNEPCSQITMNF